MSLWDNVKKFAQPYADDDYDDYDEDDDYADEYEEPAETPARRSPRRAPAPAPAAEEEADEQDDYGFTPAPAASAAPSGSAGGSPGFWRGKVLAPYSGDELVYNATLGDWRTHNGVDVAAAAGEKVPAVRAGRVTLVDADALWGGVVEVCDAEGRVWRYCGVDGSCVVGDAVAAGDVLGTAGAISAEADLDGHVHLECLEDRSSWVEPGIG